MADFERCIRIMDHLNRKESTKEEIAEAVECTSNHVYKCMEDIRLICGVEFTRTENRHGIVFGIKDYGILNRFNNDSRKRGQ